MVSVCRCVLPLFSMTFLMGPLMKRLLLTAAAWIVLLASALAAERPNILYVISDDQAWTDYGFMGHDVIQTPHLDRLASQSATFTRGYVPASLCRPSLATLITGLYPHQHKIVGNDPLYEGNRRNQRFRDPEYLANNERLIRRIEEVETLPRMLATVGYRSLQTGKWWEGQPSRGGFTAGMTHGDPEKGGRHGDVGLTIGRQGLEPIFDFIEESEDQPWFVWYAPFLPHSPHNPPERLLKKYTSPGKSAHVARYQAMCEWFDETCGELLTYLDEKGLAENTLVVYVTDNGWIQDPDSPRYAPRSKRSPYDGGLRTPIMLRWPTHIKPGRYRQTLVSSIDLVPTILAAAGVEPTEQMPGLNLIQVCRNKGETSREAVYGEIFDHDVPDVERPAAGLQYRWIVRGEWKLILPAGDEPAELYHITEDPHEARNLASEHPERVQALSAAINQW